MSRRQAGGSGPATTIGFRARTPTRPRTSSRARVLALAVAVVVAMAACGGSPAAPSAGDAVPSGLSVTTEGIEIADGVTRLDAQTASAHLKAVRSGGTLVFDGDTPDVGDLEAGSVLVLDEVGIRKVVSVAREGDRIVVTTEDATITDVVTDGKLGWTYNVAYDALPDSVYEQAMAESGLYPAELAAIGDIDARSLERFAAVKGETLRFTGKIKGFDVELKLVPKADRLEFEIAAERRNVKVQAGGFISQFVQATTMEFDSGSGTFFDASVTGLRGEAEITWHAFEVDDPSFDSDIVALVLPLGLPIEFSVGPIPMTLNIKMNLRVVPELTGGKASSGGSWKVTYDSDQGFQTNGGDPTPRSTVRDMVANLGSEPTVTAGLGVVGFGLGVEWPRLELQLGWPIFPELYEGGDADTKSDLEKAAEMLRPFVFLTTNTYVTGLWTPGTTLTADIPPCQRSSVKISAIAGYKLSVLGMVELSDNKLLWEKSVDRFKDDKPCTLTGT